MQRRGIVTDVVEIDPGVVRLASQHFGFQPSGAVTIEDARTFINRAPQRYDLVVHDTFTGGVTPAHLLSREVFVGARRLLREGGVLVVNVPGFSQGPHAAASHAIARTMREVFPIVRVFRDSAPDSHNPLSNLLFFASTEPIDVEVPADVAVESVTCHRALTQFSKWEVLKSAEPGPLVTDAHNPLVSMQMPVAAAHHAAMDKLLPAQAWLPW